MWRRTLAHARRRTPAAQNAGGARVRQDSRLHAPSAAGIDRRTHPMKTLRQAVDKLPLPENPGGLVYGTILIAALLSAESAKVESYWETLAGVALTEIIYWLALSYSEFAGDRAEDGEPFTIRGFQRSAKHELAVSEGALVPLLVLIGCWIGGVGLHNGIRFAIWASAVVIVAAELVIGIRSEQHGRELAISAGLGVVFGLLVISLRLILH
jgi:hypothetical protein